MAKIVGRIRTPPSASPSGCARYPCRSARVMSWILIAMLARPIPRRLKDVRWQSRRYSSLRAEYLPCSPRQRFLRLIELFDHCLHLGAAHWVDFDPRFVSVHQQIGILHCLIEGGA